MDTDSNAKEIEYVLRAAPSMKRYNVARFNDKEYPEFTTWNKPIMMVREPEKVDDEEDKDDDEPQAGNFAFRKKKRRRRKPTRTRGWILDDGTLTLNGSKEGGQLSTYMLMMKTGPNELSAVPIENWFRFKKPLGYRTLTLEEAEEMNNEKQRKVERWLMKHKLAGAATSDPNEIAENPRVRTGAVLKKRGATPATAPSSDDIFNIAVAKTKRSGAARTVKEADPTGDDGGDFQEKFDDDESDTEMAPGTRVMNPVQDDSDSETEELVGTDSKSLSATGQEMKELLKRHGTAGEEEKKSSVQEDEDGEDEDDDGGDKEEGDAEEVEYKRDLGGNIIRVKEDVPVADMPEKKIIKGEKRTIDQVDTSSAQQPASKLPRTATAVATRLTEASVQQELIRYGGRMKTRDLLKRFKKLLQTANDKALLKDILRTICTVEIDPIDGRILVLKSQFR